MAAVVNPTKLCCLWLLADLVMSDLGCLSVGAWINALLWFQPSDSGKEIVLRAYRPPGGPGALKELSGVCDDRTAPRRGHWGNRLAGL